MERFHRYYSLHRMLSSRRLPVPRAVIERELECSRATVNRVIDDLRGYGAPIEYLREQNGYRYTPGVAFELPGIWFNASELYALLAAQKLLADAEPGLLEDTFEPLAGGALLRPARTGDGYSQAWTGCGGNGAAEAACHGG